MSLKKIWTDSGQGHEWKRGEWYTVGLEGLNATAETDMKASYPIGAKYPGATGLFAPFIKRRRVTLNAVRPGTALVVIYYEPPTWRDILRAQPGRGTLYVDVGTEAVDAVRDKNIFGLAPGDPAPWKTGDEAGDQVKNKKWVEEGGKRVLKKWMPVTGNGLIYQSRASLRLVVLAKHVVLDTLLDLIDTTNQSDLPNFCQRKAGTLRIAGIKSHRDLSEDALYFLDILFEYNPLKWNEETTVKEFKYVTHDLELLKDDGSSFSPKRYEPVGDWIPTGFERPARKHKAEDWSVIDRMIGW